MVNLNIGLSRRTTAIAVSLFILLTATNASPLDAAIDDAIQQWNVSRPYQLTQRWDVCDWSRIATGVTHPIQRSDDHCTIAAKRGHQLLCMMVNPTSVYRQPRELAFYGYRSLVTGDDSQPSTSNVHIAMRAMEISDEQSQWFCINQGHVRNSGDFPPTGAFFQNHASPVQGAVIAYNNKNAESMNHDSLDTTLDPDQIVPLKQWSDVFF